VPELWLWVRQQRAAVARSPRAHSAAQRPQVLEAELLDAVAPEALSLSVER